METPAGATSSGGPGGGGMIQRACLFCRKRKLRCDKQRPRCQSCVRLGQECIYVGAKPGIFKPRTERSRVQELEERLGRVESLLRVRGDASARSPPSPDSQMAHEDHAVVEANSPAVLLDPETIRNLEKVYFEVVHPVLMPILHYERYTTSQDPSWPPTFLHYSIWALSSLESDQYAHLSNDYYKKARALAEAASATFPLSRRNTISLAQAWLHLAMYDLADGRYAVSWTNTSHAIRLLQIAKVHCLDHTFSFQDKTLRDSISWVDAEEERRTFWYAFLLDKSAVLGQGLPSLLDERDIRVNLPASDKAFESSTEEPGITLSQATTCGGSHRLSMLSAQVVIHSIATQKMKELRQLDSTTIDNLFNPSDWVKKSDLTKTLTAVYNVPHHLTLTKNNVDANLFFFNILVHCATIRVHRIAHKIARTRSSPLVTEFLQESMAQCLTAASAIYDLAKIASQAKIRQHHPATAFCIYTGLTTFADSYIANRDAKFSTPIAFLLNFLNPRNEHPSRAMTIDEPISQSSSIPDGPMQPAPAAEPMYDSPIPDDGRDNSSRTESIQIPYDWRESLGWSNQLIADASYGSLFRNNYDFALDCQPPPHLRPD
ncbi:fungal-specific transcription factor domain-containing protein [Xylogone sp. PMI_703]|nr:fungal-specific transcription factor domain-containing protein [Xylogone sp. PMI_703]